MRMRKIKQAKRKHQIENFLLKLLIVAAVVLILGTIGGIWFANYLLMQCGYY